VIEPFFPDAATLLAVAPLALVNALAAAAFVARLHIRRGVRTAYTRKVFHFIIITVAAGVHVRWGLPGVVTYGAVVAGVVLAAVVRGDGDSFYEALARPADAPHRSLFILVPLSTTALGGLLAGLLFPAWAHVGYLAVAWGDAIGEPVGTRWGRHRYRVPSLAGVPATRSLEGSAAVFAATTLAAYLAVVAGAVPGSTALAASLIIGAACAGVEAISHHGVDNLTLQITGAGLAALLLG
jgi:phytol kinase